MKDIYDGVVRTNAKGFAAVRMARYFQALNRSFRYQLTPIGHNAWGAQAIVWDPIKAKRFVIRSRPHVKISWQVTGVAQAEGRPGQVRASAAVRQAEVGRDRLSEASEGSAA
jgi:hypothetical protein